MGELPTQLPEEQLLASDSVARPTHRDRSVAPVCVHARTGRSGSSSGTRLGDKVNDWIVGVQRSSHVGTIYRGPTQTATLSSSGRREDGFGMKDEK